MKLNAELPMTSTMYLKLVNKFSNDVPICGNCRHSNGECANFAKAGTCNMMNKEINNILVFHDGDTEFATTRDAIAHALEVNQENEENAWIDETVNAVIEDYCSKAEFGEENVFASILYNLLSLNDIIAHVHWADFD